MVATSRPVLRVASLPPMLCHLSLRRVREGRRRDPEARVVAISRRVLRTASFPPMLHHLSRHLVFPLMPHVSLVHIALSVNLVQQQVFTFIQF